MASIDDKIREFGQKRQSEELQEYMKNVDIDELLKVIKNKLSHPTFTYTWSYILQGFTDDPNSHDKRFQVINTVLKELESNEVSSTHCNSIIHRLCMEVGKIQSKHLLELCDFCIKSLQSQRVSHLSWKDLLPEVLNVLVECEAIEHDGSIMTGKDYKHQFIELLCSVQWSSNIVTTLTSMFIDMPLSKDEHLKVVNKLCQYIEKMIPQEIPSFVYQLLRLCKKTDSKAVFQKLQDYFGMRIYENLSNQVESGSDNTDVDAIGDTNEQDTIEAESTVLYHIHSSASLGQECIKDYLTSLKNLLRSPEFILHPFQLAVLLTISTIPHYEERVFEIVRSCVSKTYHEEQKKLNSAWFRDIVPTTCKIELIFVQIVNLSAQERELVLQGLVNFAFVLLGVGSALGRDLIAEKQWQLGSMILFKVIKKKRHIAPVIIQQLSNCIITGQNVTHYIECMYLIAKNLPLLMLENKSLIIEIMEGLVQMPPSNANQLLVAIIPLVKVSPTIRDHFILLLRKSLYSKNSETRQMAVSGFLKLLTSLKISNLAVLSQNSGSSGSFSSGYSLFTQVSLSRSSQSAPSAFSNEALCLEVLGILRRCFMQQAEVKIQLYEGLFDAVCLNPELGIPVLDVIWSHFSEFYNVDDEVLPPLKFEKITVTKNVTVILQEPVGKLMYTMGLIASKVAQSDPENSTVGRFQKILESICTRMAKCELVHFELDDGTDLLDIMPEAQQKLLILKEVLSVYEALIGYKIYSWGPQSENCGKEVNNLFQGYSRFSHFSKNLTKPKKVENKKKKGADVTAQETSSNISSKKEGQKSTKSSFKMPYTVLDFQVMGKIMSLLHESLVDWTTISNASAIKTKREFHQHMMQANLNLITSLKNKKIIETQYAKMIFDFLSEIGLILYERIIKRLTEFIDFDCATSIMALECFLLILNIVSQQFKSNFVLFLSKVGRKNKDEDLVTHLTEFVETYERLFEIDEEEITEDPEIKKLSLVVINTLNFLADHVPVTNNALSVQLTDWLKNYAVTNTLSSRQVASSFIHLLFDSFVKFKVSLTFFENVSFRVGDVTGVLNEEEHDAEEIKVITELTVNSAILSLCNTLKSLLEDIDWIISRLKAEYVMITYPGQSNIEKKKEKLKNKERGVCCQLCFVVTILTNLSNCTVPPGNLSEAILKNLTLLYSTLSSLTKYFMARSSKVNPVFQGARFEKLVKLAGKQLAPVVYKLILYIEESQKQDSSSQSNKKKVNTSSLKSKVLKETRLIPKVVYEIEQFSKFVIQLSNKTKIDLSKFVGQGTVRDFRILHLKEVLEQAKDGEPSATQSTQESNSSLVEDEDNDDVNTPPPPTKKSRKS